MVAFKSQNLDPASELAFAFACGSADLMRSGNPNHKAAAAKTLGAAEARYATKPFDDGSVYAGELKDGMRHGHGVMMWADSDVYDGQ